MPDTDHRTCQLAIDAHKARADQMESRAIEAERQLARFADQAERYEELAGQAAASERVRAEAGDLRRCNDVLARHRDWVEAELEKTDAEIARLKALPAAADPASPETGGQLPREAADHA
jgi:hypothetical protein